MPPMISNLWLDQSKEKRGIRMSKIHNPQITTNKVTRFLVKEFCSAIIM